MRHKKQYKWLLALWLHLTLMPQLQAQTYSYAFDSLCQKAYTQILNLQLDSATYSIQQAQNQQAYNLMPQLLYNYKDIVYLILTEDKTAYDSLKPKRKERIEKWSQGNKNSPWQLSGEAQIKLQWAFASVLFGDYFSAARDIRSAYLLLEKNKAKHPDFLVDNMGIGILHSMIGIIPDQYQWAVELFGFSGTIEQGIEEVEQQIMAVPHREQLSAEALFYYTFLKANLLNEKNRVQQILQLFDKDEFKEARLNSPLLHFAYCNLLLRENNDSAITELSQFKEQEHTLHFHYLDFLLGKALVYKNDVKAVPYLQHYIKHYPGKNYKKSAMQSLAWYYFMQGDTALYLQHMNAIARTNGGLMDADKSAEKESKLAAKGILPNVHLLKGRLFFDGHYYQKALAALAPLKVQQEDKELLLEYHYRKGRILQEMGKYSEAIQSYEMAIQSCENSNRYFTGRAALESGNIYQQMGKMSAAKAAYERCLSLPFSEYRRGIRAKAKAGLQSLK